MESSTVSDGKNIEKILHLIYTVFDEYNFTICLDNL